MQIISWDGLDVLLSLFIYPLLMDEWMDGTGWMYGWNWMDGWMDGTRWMGGWMDVWMELDGWMVEGT